MEIFVIENMKTNLVIITLPFDCIYFSSLFQHWDGIACSRVPDSNKEYNHKFSMHF